MGHTRNFVRGDEQHLMLEVGKIKQHDFCVCGGVLSSQLTSAAEQGRDATVTWQLGPRSD
jgi:hypothetical protein